MKVKLLSLLFFSLFTCLYAQNEFWQKVSHVDAGNSVSMAVDSLGYVYNGTSDEGLFQSTDHGKTWKKLETGFYKATVKKVRVIPDGSIAVLTADYGILISKDHGKTWRQRIGSLNAQDILTMSASSEYLLAGTSNGLYKSSDGGNSWKADSAFSGMKVVEIEYLNGVLFCFSRKDNFVFATSTDGGHSWVVSSLRYEGFDYVNASFAYLPSAGKVFCALSSTLDQNSYRRWVYSNDTGKTWSNYNPGGYVNSWIADTSGNLYAACFKSGVIKSSDMGVTWQKSGSGISNTFIQSIAFDPKGRIYAGTTGSVISSNDNGKSWESYTTGLNNTGISEVAVDLNGNIYASFYDGFYWSKDKGANWQAVTEGLNMLSLSRLRQINNNIFIYSEEFYGMDIFINDCHRFNQALNKWTSCDSSIFVFIDELAKDNNGDIYSFYQHYSRGMSSCIYRSTDDGKTWTYRDLDVDSKSSFTIDAKGTFFLTTSSSRGIIKSYDKGMTWESTGYSEKSAKKIRSSSKGYLFLQTDDNRMLLSKDGGSSWTSIIDNFPNSGIADFYLDSKDRIYILDKLRHLYYSADNGGKWTSITNNLLGPGIKCIALGPDLSIYAVTLSGEIYRTTELGYSGGSTDSTGTPNINDPKDSTNASISAPKDYSLSQNYPNPFNPNTTISYAIPHAGNVSISLFDALGNKVMDLVNEYKSEGIYKVNFDGKNFASGVYFYRIHSGNYIETKKLMLIK
ncbi:MAG: T9SS type A sorting domain-containing protein [Ignavibacteria bacterium]|jgi:photosystem II stability/assembly factor-like uncharacterized protein|nr:T9SS type A sorting domain-containing protein [Ignavibacteria bacterium]MCU7501632.1 T9SS type A sorting domain-containing protein [Ignavibacteria bacterium]MCU7517779.1 T9SS type A sorting domain-containing protein [Ignavibacteria bacterium]